MMKTCNNEHIAIQWSASGGCPLCACFDRIVETEGALKEARRQRDYNIRALENIKAALDMPGTGSYVDWAQELREFYQEKIDELQQALQFTRHDVEVLTEAVKRLLCHVPNYPTAAYLKDIEFAERYIK